MKPIKLSKIGIAGKFRMEVLRPDGTVKIDTGWQDNLVTDSGLDSYATAANNSLAFRYIQVGSGSATPETIDTALQTYMAGIQIFPELGDTNSGYNNVSPRYYWDEATQTFAVGAVVGNVAELGLASAGTGGVLFSRALIKDAGGDPTTVTVLSDEQLRITYQVRYYLNETDDTYALDLGEWSGTVTTRFGKMTSGTAASGFFGGRSFEAGAWPMREPVRVFPAGSTLGDINSLPSGTPETVERTASFVGSYSSGSYSRTVRIEWTSAQGNLSGGIQALLVIFVGHGSRQFHFDTPIPKDNTKKLRLDFTVTWGRYTP